MEKRLITKKEAKAKGIEDLVITEEDFLSVFKDEDAETYKQVTNFYHDVENN